jgi:hypothetical protein
MDAGRTTIDAARGDGGAAESGVTSDARADVSTADHTVDVNTRDATLSEAGPADASGGDGASCDAGRQGWNELRAMLLPDAQKCSQDGECIFASFEDECGNICPLPLSGPGIGDFGNSIYAYASAHCASCPPAPIPTCTTPANMAVACIGGVCAWKN